MQQNKFVEQQNKLIRQQGEMQGEINQIGKCSMTTQESRRQHYQHNQTQYSTVCITTDTKTGHTAHDEIINATCGILNKRDEGSFNNGESR